MIGAPYEFDRGDKTKDFPMFGRDSRFTDDTVMTVAVPEAVTAFLEGGDFEDVIRTAVSLGGDCDTLTCIAGSIAEAFYGVPEELIKACRQRLPEDILQVVDRFQDDEYILKFKRIDARNGRTRGAPTAPPLTPKT